MDFLKQIPQLPAFKAVKNELCKNHTIETIGHILQGSPWALKMFDSSTKFPEGVLAGTLVHMGDYEECLDVNVKEEWGSFKGQHCLVDASVNTSMYFEKEISVPFTWAVCLPSSCDAADLKDFLTTAFHHPVNVNPLGCHIQETRPFLPLDWLAIGILSFFGLLCILSTAYDLIVSDPRKRRELLLVFSWYTNCKLLLKTKRSASTLDCLHGIRFLSIAWIVLGHAYASTFILPAANILYFFEHDKRWEHCLLKGALFAVDSFLTLSGTLLCYIFMTTMSKGRNFSFIVYFLHRYMRTTPLMAVIIPIHIGLLRHFGSGPIWDMHVQERTIQCKQNWWATVLHIQNYVIPFAEMCIPETWYVSVDMQLYLFSLLLLLPLLKRPKFGLILLEVVTTISVISAFLGLYFDSSSQLTFLPQQYVHTHVRATPWLVGMTLGYGLFHTTQWRKDVAAKTRSGLSKKVLGAGWTLAGVCLVAPILVQQQLIRDDLIPSHLEWNIFLPLARLIWSLGVSWVIFVCVSGYGGPVNAFLSWKFFIPLSRLTYAIYILHLSFIEVYLLATKTVLRSDDMEKVMLSPAVLIYTTLLAIPASVTFETPVIRIQNFLLGFQKEQKDIQPEINNASYQEEKIHNDPFPGAVMNPGSSFSKELNTAAKYSISGGQSVHKAMQNK